MALLFTIFKKNILLLAFLVEGKFKFRLTLLVADCFGKIVVVVAACFFVACLKNSSD